MPVPRTKHLLSSHRVTRQDDLRASEHFWAQTFIKHFFGHQTFGEYDFLSIGREDALDVFGAVCLGKSQHKQNSRLLRI